MSHVHIVYAHPSGRGFTREVLGAFLEGLTARAHTCTVSDLYAMRFRSELSEATASPAAPGAASSSCSAARWRATSGRA